MECNKEEALRAKDIAVGKMRSSDFAGALMTVLKAQRLFPGLENISQLLTICEVHCSAQRTLNGAEKDWYEILKVEKTADETTIKKQYRKLAFLLHPDKNKFASAEAAFKLIGEASRVLTDQDKRKLYDMKCRMPVRPAAAPKAPNRPVNKNIVVKKPNVANPPANSKVQQAQQTQTRHYNMPGFFWTCCPICRTRFQYSICVVNKNVCCQTCQNPYTAYDLDPQPVPAVPSNQNENLNPAARQVGAQSTNGNPTSGYGVPESFLSKKVAPDPVTNVGSSAKLKEDDVKPKNAAKIRNSKRKRKSDMGSTESLDSTSGNSEDVGDKFNYCGFAGQGTGSNTGEKRRFTRQKQNISYKEKLSEDELASPIKKSQVSFSSCAAEDVIKSPDCSASEDEYPDPDFHDFDKGKAEECFCRDQMWAVYDGIDSMPRFYVRLRRVLKTEFKLQITWLEAYPGKVAEFKWAEEGLPVACGNFIQGTNENLDRLTFSHKVQVETLNCNGKISYLIYPRKGETWALFKDWDIGWRFNPEKHKPPYKFELVEIISDYDKDGGIWVVYLSKVRGFVSLFKQSLCNGSPFKIAPGELFRFSHQVPSFRMTGVEREGVPRDSIELDPVSLPRDLDQFYDATDINLTKESTKCPSKPDSIDPREKLTPRRSMRESNKSNSTQLPEKSVKGVEANDCKYNRVESNQTDKKFTTPKKHENKDSDNEKLMRRKSPRAHNEGISVKADEEIQTLKKNANRPNGLKKKLPELKLYDFKESKTEKNFSVDQIWALYSNEHGLPAKFAQIKEKRSVPELELLVMLFQLSPPKGVIFPNGCGTFKVLAKKTLLLKPEAFSHQVKATRNGKSFNIYPRVGEIWAMYKKWNAKSKRSEPCQIVQVVDVTFPHTIVSALVRVYGSAPIYKTSSGPGSNNHMFQISQVELVRRFSHQVPAFWHTGEVDTNLRDCWQLDLSAIPGNDTVCLD